MSKKYFQKIDYSLLGDEKSGSSGSGSDSEPEMFDNVKDTSVPAQMIIDSDSEADPTPIKKPAPAKRKLGPQPSKRKIISDDSDVSPVKKKVDSYTFQLFLPIFTFSFAERSEKEEEQL